MTSRKTGLNPGLRVLFSALGLLLVGLAGVTNYSHQLLFADHWPYPGTKGQPTGFIRLPGWPEHQYRFFPLWWLLLGLPLMLVASGLFFQSFRRALVAPWRSRRFALPLLLTLLVFVFTIMPWDFVTAKPHETGAQMMLYLYLASAGFVLLMVGAWPGLRVLDRPMQRLGHWLMNISPGRFMLLSFGVTFLATNLIAYFVFEHMPHIQDSIAQLFQARIFATGRLFLPSPRFPDFFDYTHIINNGRWYSQYPFLHSLILLGGVLVRAPWLINPLLGSLTIPLIYILGRELYDERTGRLGAGLGCLSPFILNMSSEFMNHATALLFTVLFLIYYFRTLRDRRWSQAALAGIFLGLVANVRPYTGILVGLPFAVYLVSTMVRAVRRYWAPAVIMALAAAAVASLVLVYNWLTNGHPLLFGYVVKWGPGHELGFGKSGWGPQHTPYKGLLNTGNDFNLIQKFLFEWPSFSLLPAACLFACGIPARGIRDRRDWLLGASFLALTLGHYFYWFHNVCFGPRFLYESSAALLLLTVRGTMALPDLLGRTFRVQFDGRALARLVSRALPVATLFMLGVGLPPLFRQYHTYGGVDALVHRTVQNAGVHNALVFCSHFGNGFSFNSLTLDSDIVYAKDYGILNAALTTAYPSRAYYYAHRDTLRPLPNIAYPQSQLRQTLTELAEYLQDSVRIQDYRNIIWPFRDLPPEKWPSGVAADKLTDFREVSRAIFTQKRTLADYTPALACWVINDTREHLRIFSFMDELESFVAGNNKFTLFKITRDGAGAVYEIRPATGEEVTIPDRPRPVPVR